MTNTELIDYYKKSVVSLIASLVEKAAHPEQTELLKTIMAESLVLSAMMHRASGGNTDSFVEMAKHSISLTHHGGANMQ